MTDSILSLARQALEDDAKATRAPWFARNRHLSLTPDGGGLGATLPTNHIGVMSERDDASFVAAARTREPQLAKAVVELSEDNEKLRAGLDYAISENLAFNIKVATEINEARRGRQIAIAERDSLRAEVSDMRSAGDETQAMRERDSALARVKDLEELLGYSREGVAHWTKACERFRDQLAVTRAALVEACKIAKHSAGRIRLGQHDVEEALVLDVYDKRIAEPAKLGAKP